MLVGYSPYRTMQTIKRTSFKANDNDDYFDPHLINLPPKEPELSPKAREFYGRLKKYKGDTLDDRMRNIRLVYSNELNQLFYHNHDDVALSALKEIDTAAETEQHWTSPYVRAYLKRREGEEYKLILPDWWREKFMK